MSKRSRKAQVWIAHQEADHLSILLFKVLDTRGGGWHPVTGGVDKDEKFLEGAKREVSEETGFSENDGKWIDLDFSFQFEGRWGRAEERAFGLILKRSRMNPVLDPKEHTEFEWVPYEEALKRVQFDSQRGALQKFSCYFD